MATTTAQRHIIWAIGADPGAPTVGLFRESLPDGYAMVAVDVEDAWSGPIRHRPMGVVVFGLDGQAEIVAGLLHRLRRRTPLPLLVVIDGVDTDQQHQLMRAGAAAVLKLASNSDGAVARSRLRLHRTLELMLESTRSSAALEHSQDDIRIVAIGSSTGGPDVLKRLLCDGDGAFRVPVVIAQHVTRNFDDQLAKWLEEMGMPCRVPADGDPLEAGLAQLAPATQDLVVQDGHCRLKPSESTNVPSADRLLASVAREYGKRAVGIVLTGMGRDGAIGLQQLQQAGGYTITQRGDTCVVDGMPASARELHAQCVDWTPDEIASYLDKFRSS